MQNRWQPTFDGNWSALSQQGAGTDLDGRGQREPLLDPFHWSRQGPDQQDFQNRQQPGLHLDLVSRQRELISRQRELISRSRAFILLVWDSGDNHGSCSMIGPDFPEKNRSVNRRLISTSVTTSELYRILSGRLSGTLSYFIPIGRSLSVTWAYLCRTFVVGDHRAPSYDGALLTISCRSRSDFLKSQKSV